MKLSDIVYEKGQRFILKGSKGGYEVWENGFTHSTRKATIHFSDDIKSLERAKKICDEG